MNSFFKTRVGSALIFKSKNIVCAHGFSTRFGGVSGYGNASAEQCENAGAEQRENENLTSAEYLSSLNFGFNRGDPDDNVHENYRRFMSYLGMENCALLSACQIHSDRVFYSDGKSVFSDGKKIISDIANDGNAFGQMRMQTILQGDAFVTDADNTALCVKIADCVPVLLCDIKNHVIGAAHAGWRGTASGIAARTVETMCAHGAKPESICAAIGPSIHSCCYEVGEDMFESCKQLVGADFAARFIKYSDGFADIMKVENDNNKACGCTENGQLVEDCIKSGSGKKRHAALHCDLQAMNREFLLLSGLKDENISISDECTCCSPDIFFSHRATNEKRGTMAAAISLF